MAAYPYADRFPVLRGMPSEGRDRNAVVAELRELATDEDTTWETGKCSGTMYCGDHDHYDFMNEVFGMYSHMNVLQRDMCPSATRFEGEIIAMTLDLMHGDQADSADDGPVGLITSGGSGSILHAVLAYREWAQNAQGIDASEHRQARDRAPGVRQGVPPRRDRTAQRADRSGHHPGRRRRRSRTSSTRTRSPSSVPPATTATARSTRSPSCRTLALSQDIGLHVDGCLGGFILPWGEQLGYDIPPFDFRVPGVTSISADTHKYAYGLKGTSVLSFRDKRPAQRPVLLPDRLDRREVLLPGDRRIAVRRAAGGHLGGHGLARTRGLPALREGDLRDGVQDAGRGATPTPSCDMMGAPTFCFSFTSDEFDIYHVNDFMRTRGWRFNGQQYPNSIHMAVTRPQTQHGRRRHVRRSISPRPWPTRSSTRTRPRRAARSTAGSPVARAPTRPRSSSRSWLR